MYASEDPDDQTLATTSHATEAWYSEVENYDWANPKYQSGTGHFTQVVWKDSIKLGIGKATGKIDKLFCTWVVGRYSPAGNVMGKFQENVLKPQYCSVQASEIINLQLQH